MLYCKYITSYLLCWEDTSLKITDIDISKQAFIYAAIHILANRMQAIGNKVDPTISTKQWFVLAAVSKFNTSTPNIGDIAEALGTSRQNIMKIAKILEHRGFLKLERDENDLRSIRLFLTAQCNEYLKGREQQENKYLDNIFLGMDDEVLTVLRDGMSKLIENIDALLDIRLLA